MTDPVTTVDTPARAPVTLINAFSVAAGDSAERFLSLWSSNARIMAAQPGFIRARMYRSLGEDGVAVRQRRPAGERDGAAARG